MKEKNQTVPAPPAHTQSSNATLQQIPYDSNPFSLTFNGLSLLVEYARGIFIAIIAVGFLGFIGNFSDSFSKSNSASNIFPAESSASATTSSISSDTILSIVIVIVASLIIFGAIGLIISTILKGVGASSAVAASQKRKITIGQAFSEMSSRFKVLLLAEFLAALRIIGGYLALIVPGIRAQLRYQSTPYIIMLNKDISANEALQSSKDLYSSHLMEVFGINFVSSLIPVVGPGLNIMGMSMSVQQIKAYKDAQQQTPKTHFLNYLGLIAIIVFAFIIISVISLVLSLSF